MKKKFDYKKILFVPFQEVRIPAWALLLVVVAIVVGGVLATQPRESVVVEEPVVVVEEPEEVYFSWLDGREQESEESVVPYAIMIDHALDSGLPIGIDQAPVVFETLVEGGVTRLMALFDPRDNIEYIGPVRSARPYFVDWAQGFGAVYAHAGGSPTALSLIKDIIIKDINEIGSDGKYFWRSKNREAPHNLFTSSELMNEAFAVKEWELTRDEQLLPWEWQESVEGVEEEQNALSVLIDFSRTSYTVAWEYNLEDSAYQRYRSGKLAQTSDGTNLVAKNVVVQFVDIGLEDELRLTMETLGDGDAVVCSLGICKEGEWKRAATNEPTQFFVENELVVVVPGNTWIAVVPNGRSVTWE